MCYFRIGFCISVAITFRNMLFSTYSRSMYSLTRGLTDVMNVPVSKFLFHLVRLVKIILKEELNFVAFFQPIHIWALIIHYRPTSKMESDIGWNSNPDVNQIYWNLGSVLNNNWSIAYDFWKKSKHFNKNSVAKLPLNASVKNSKVPKRSPLLNGMIKPPT